MSNDGRMDVSAVETVCVQIARVLASAPVPRPHCVAIRSTIVPGTLVRCIDLMAREGSLEPGRDFTVVANPEFMREGSAVGDFMDPPFTIVGAQEPGWAEPLVDLYGFLEAPFHLTGPGVAEILKLVCNSWHATKVAFANEIGRICGPSGIDAREVMDLFAGDRKLNVSSSYLRPGFAYGGSCLPKDLASLEALARRAGREVPLLAGVRRSNELSIAGAAELIASAGHRRIAFLGLSFKRRTDDLRGSPLVDLVRRCRELGLAVHAHDPCVETSRLVGSNLRYASEALGELGSLVVSSLDDLRGQADLFVLGHADPDFVEFCESLPASCTVVDLVGSFRGSRIAARVLRLD